MLSPIIEVKWLELAPDCLLQLRIVCMNMVLWEGSRDFPSAGIQQVGAAEQSWVLAGAGHTGWEAEWKNKNGVQVSSLPSQITSLTCTPRSINDYLPMRWRRPVSGSSVHPLAQPPPLKQPAVGGGVSSSASNTQQQLLWGHVLPPHLFSLARVCCCYSTE